MKKKDRLLNNGMMLLMVLTLFVVLFIFFLDLIDITKYIKLSKEYDWLAFTGSIFGGFITFLGVLLTLKYEENKRKKDLSITYKPILQPYAKKRTDEKGYNTKFLRDKKILSQATIQNLRNDKYISFVYGDYKKLPPEDKRTTLHNTVKIDLDTSYINYKGKYYCVNNAIAD